MTMADFEHGHRNMGNCASLVVLSFCDSATFSSRFKLFCELTDHMQRRIAARLVMPRAWSMSLAILVLVAMASGATTRRPRAAPPREAGFSEPSRPLLQGDVLGRRGASTSRKGIVKEAAGVSVKAEATPACDTDGKCTDSVAITGCGEGNEAKATYSIQLCCPGSKGSAACNKREQCGAQVHDLATIPDFNVTLKYGFELVTSSKMRIVNDAGKTLLEAYSIPDDCRGSFSNASATLYKAASLKAINTAETKCKLPDSKRRDGHAACPNEEKGLPGPSHALFDGEKLSCPCPTGFSAFNHRINTHDRTLDESALTWQRLSQCPEFEFGKNHSTPTYKIRDLTTGQVPVLDNINTCCRHKNMRAYKAFTYGCKSDWHGEYTVKTSVKATS